MSPDSTEYVYLSNSNNIQVYDQNVYSSGYKLHKDKDFCLMHCDPVPRKVLAI